jgi:hypothetical protein
MKFIQDYVKCNTDLQVIFQSYNFKKFSHLTRLYSRIFLQMLQEDFTVFVCVCDRERERVSNVLYPNSMLISSSCSFCTA